MNFLENLRTALTAIGANKLRSLLTMLGVIIGVYAVSTMLALGQMATETITGQLSEIGGRQIFIAPKSEPGRVTFKNFDQDDVDALTRLPVVNVSTIRSSVQATSLNWSGSLALEGTSADYPALLGSLKMKYGRYFSEAEELGSAPVVVLTQNTAEKLFGKTNPLGQNIRILQQIAQGEVRREELTVIGVTASQGGLFSGMAGDLGYIPLHYAWRYFYTRNEYPYLVLRVQDNANQLQTQQDVRRILTARHGSEEFEIQNFDQFVDQFRMITSVLQTMLAGTGALSLLVGGIGIMNIMLVSVTERTREIGLRKALGAKRSTILGQFLIEAMALTGLGGVLGYVLSMATVLMLSKLLPDFFPTVVLSPFVAALAIGVSVLIGLVFGVWPASRAANLTPIEALRYE